MTTSTGVQRLHDFLFRMLRLEDSTIPDPERIGCDVGCYLCNKILPKKTDIYTLEYEPHDEPHLTLYACEYCYDKIHRADSDRT